MAAQVSKKFCSVLIIVILFSMMFSAQVAHSNTIDVCIKDCVTNQCMKASKKATQAICGNPCKMICDPIKNGGQYIVPGKGYQDPVKRFCSAFSWICE
ncbi:uncharacterized protein LOC18026140 [Eutrema salsugineum]|uniref:uncharacterized protein LOC18026140 n=1 Tax=Eutrema salsugineum TaxID=72664 RepID=UPI000CED464F|nr:uncharacterized protein LOC18026140 [Eutrema salsugineum]